MANYDDLLMQAGIDLSKFSQDKKALMNEVLGMNEEMAKGGDGIAKALSRVISDQKAAIKDIEKELAAVYKNAEGMAPGRAQANVLGEATKIEGDLSGAKQQLSDMQSLKDEFTEMDGAVTRLSTKFNEAKNRLAELNLAAKEGKDIAPEQFAAAEAEVKKYGKAITETNAQVKAMTAGGLGAMAQGLSLITGTLGTAIGLQGSFGGSSENLNQIMTKTQALLSATVTLQEIKNTAIQQGGVISGVMAVQEMARSRATLLAAASTGKATIAQRLLNVVANANPYVLLATAIITVVGAIAMYVSASSKAAKLTGELNKKMADSAADPIIEYKKLQAQWNALGNDLKGKKKFIDENKDSFKKLGVSVSGVSDAENVFVKNSNAMVASIMLRARAAAAMEMATEQYKKGLQAQMDAQEEAKILKNGSLVEKAGVRLKQNARFTTLEDQAKEEMKSANELIKKSIGYDKAGENLKIKGGINPYQEAKKAQAAKSTASKKTAADTADEYLPPGSVAEIQKRLAGIDEALQKATDPSKIDALKERRLAAALELAAAEKKIRIRSFDEEHDETKKQIELRDKLLQAGYSNEKVDSMFPEVKDKSYLSYLQASEEAINKLISAGDNTEQTADNLMKVRAAIDEYQGNETFIDGVSKSIDNLKAKFSGSELISELEKFKNFTVADGSTEAEQNAKRLAAEQAIKQEEDALRAGYQSFLKDHQTYEEQKAAITKKYADLRAQANTPEAVKKVNQAEAADTSALDMEFLQKTEDWKMAFGNVESYTKATIERILANLIAYRDSKKDALQPTEEAELAKAIQKLQAAASRNPFTAIVTGLKEYKAARLAVVEAEKQYNAVLAANGGNKNTDEAVAAYKKLAKAEREAAENNEKLVGGLQKAQGIFNEAGNAVMDVADAFGGMSDGAKDAIGDIMEVGNAAFDLATSIASGDVAGMIKAGVKLIGSLFKAFSGDKKKERKIKEQAKQLKVLELAFNDIAFAAEKAYGSMKYKGQTDMIKNLQQQQAAIQTMMAQEQSKKKKDNEKIAGYQQQLQAIDQQIANIKEGIIKDVLQTDIVDAASKVGDALVDAFGRGEDSVKSLENAAQDMIKNLLRNQLNLALQNKMKPILDNLLASTGFNQDGTGTFTGLTPQQIADFKAQVVAAGQSMNGFLEAYSDIFSDLETPAEGLKGDIKGVTEKTAGALESQINMMRIYQVEALVIHRANKAVFESALLALVQIEVNTRRLHSIDESLKSMDDKMKKGLAGI